MAQEPPACRVMCRLSHGALPLLCSFPPFNFTLDDGADELSPRFLLTQHGINARQGSAPETSGCLFLVDAFAAHDPKVRQNMSSGQLLISTAVNGLGDIFYG